MTCKNQEIGEFQIDIVVENTVILELKSLQRHDPIFESQG
ncbi:MAG: hypothetical protein JXQ65_00160 [Candidatus Marinimicrobia bacterium]|nr:hypothetical protein [Candidatus Neomarinimicrobiota bacterium]